MLHSPNWTRHFLLSAPSTQEICSEKKTLQKGTNWCSARFTQEFARGCKSFIFCTQSHVPCALLLALHFNFQLISSSRCYLMNVFCCVVKLLGSMSMMWLYVFIKLVNYKDLVPALNHVCVQYFESLLQFLVEKIKKKVKVTTCHVIIYVIIVWRLVQRISLSIHPKSKSPWTALPSQYF